RPLAERAVAGDWPPPSLVLLSVTLYGAGDEAASLRVLRMAAGSHPTDAWVHYNLGGLLYRTSPPRMREAIEALAAARALRPELGHELAHALEKDGRSEEAEAVFRDLVRRSPENGGDLMCLARHLNGRGRADEAGPFLNRSIAAGRKRIE